MSIPTIAYVVVAVSFALFCLALYVLDLRAKVKKQAELLNEQKRQSQAAANRGGGMVVSAPNGSFTSMPDSELNSMPNMEAEKEEKAEADELDSEQKLFVRCCQYLYEKHPFTNPDLRIEDLTRELGTNRTTLGSCVRKYSAGNLTTQQLVTRYRLRYAEHLLSDVHSELNVSQVAEASGFNSRSTFNRQFSLLFGCSPMDYRERVLSQAEGVTPSNRENTLEK